MTTTDNSALVAAIARLTASDQAAITMVQTLRDSGKQMIADLAAVKQQLADAQSGTDTATAQAAIDAITKQLTDQATAIENAVANNTQAPDLPPVPTPAPSPPVAQALASGRGGRSSHSGR